MFGRTITRVGALGTFHTCAGHVEPDARVFGWCAQELAQMYETCGAVLGRCARPLWRVSSREALAWGSALAGGVALVLSTGFLGGLGAPDLPGFLAKPALGWHSHFFLYLI